MVNDKPNDDKPNDDKPNDDKPKKGTLENPNMRVRLEGAEPKQVENLLRGLYILFVWIALAVIVIVSNLVLNWFSLATPQLLIALPLVVGILLTMLMLNEYGWEAIKQEKIAFIRKKIDEQVQSLTYDELLEVKQGMKKLYVKLAPGLHISDDNELLQETHQRRGVDEMLNDLNEKELIELRQRLGIKNTHQAPPTQMTHETEKRKDYA